MNSNLIRNFLNKVESKEITIVPDFNIYDAYSGNYTYKASNGWNVTVFIDCGEWDYIDSIEDNSGNIISDFDRDLNNYRPNQKVIKEVYSLTKDQPYYSEDWVHWNNDDVSKHVILNCDICNNKAYLDYRYFQSTSDLMKVIDSFSILHYYCNPIYHSNE